LARLVARGVVEQSQLPRFGPKGVGND
jgi:hypothetical protein